MASTPPAPALVTAVAPEPAVVVVSAVVEVGEEEEEVGGAPDVVTLGAGAVVVSEAPDWQPKRSSIMRSEMLMAKSTMALPVLVPFTPGPLSSPILTSKALLRLTI